MLAKYSREVFTHIKSGIRSALMDEVVLPMQNGGTDRLISLHQQRREAGGKLPRPLTREYNSLAWNARILKFFAGTDRGRKITDWLAK